LEIGVYMFARFFHAGVILAAVVWGLSGCATQATVPVEQAVQQRAELRWRNLMTKNWSGAYELLAPSYRKIHDLEHYRSSFRGDAKWLGSKVLSVACEAEKCTVRVELTVSMPFARKAGDTLSTVFDEVWLAEAGGWYYYEKP